LKFTKTVILLGLAGYEPTASLVIYISSYQARPRRITVKYILIIKITISSIVIGSKNSYFPLIGQLVIGQFAIVQFNKPITLNQPITFKVVV